MTTLTFDESVILADFPDIEPAILADPHLQYYYTFDDLASFPAGQAVTPDFVPDTSGKPGDRNLQAINRDRDGGVFTTDSAILPTTAGDSMQFNFLQFQWLSWGAQLGLLAQHNLPIEYPFRGAHPDLPVGTGSAFMAWLAYIPFDPIIDLPYIHPYDPPGPTMPVIATWYREFGIGNFGAQLGFYEPAENIGGMYYMVGGTNESPGYSWQSSTLFDAYEWVHFCSSIEKIGQTETTSYFRRRIWINGELATVLEGNRFVTGAVYEPRAPLSLGTSHSDDLRMGHGKGMVDGVAYFSYPITIRESWGIIAA